MALVVKDRVQETTITVGTIALVLAGAVSGFQSFSAIGDGNTTYYAVVGGTEWEVGIGTYTALGTVLSRDTILSSSNGGSAVNFSAGTKNVFVTYPADKSIYDDASGNVIALGTPASVTLTNGTGLPISTGVSGLGTGVATFLATPSSANLASAVTDETGSGSLVFATLPTFGATGVKFSGSTSGTTTVLSGATAGTSVLTLPVATDTLVGKTTTDTLTNKTLTSPTLTTPVLGTPSSGTLTSCTGLPLTTGVTGTLPVANGGTNQTTYTDGQLLIGNTTGNTLAKSTLTAGTGISVTNGSGTITIANTSPNQLTTTTGSPAYYGARAWVNFNGTGTVAIRASVNVSSITDNATGDYTVNFTTAMPDANYSANTNSTRATLISGADVSSVISTTTPTTSAYRFYTMTGSGTFVDALFACVSIFR